MEQTLENDIFTLVTDKVAPRLKLLKKSLDHYNNRIHSINKNYYSCKRKELTEYVRQNLNCNNADIHFSTYYNKLTYTIYVNEYKYSFSKNDNLIETSYQFINQSECVEYNNILFSITENIENKIYKVLKHEKKYNEYAKYYTNKKDIINKKYSSTLYDQVKRKITNILKNQSLSLPIEVNEIKNCNPFRQLTDSYELTLKNNYLFSQQAHDDKKLLMYNVSTYGKIELHVYVNFIINNPQYINLVLRKYKLAKFL